MGRKILGFLFADAEGPESATICVAFDQLARLTDVHALYRNGFEKQPTVDNASMVCFDEPVSKVLEEITREASLAIRQEETTMVIYQSDSPQSDIPVFPGAYVAAAEPQQEQVAIEAYEARQLSNPQNWKEISAPSLDDQEAVDLPPLQEIGVNLPRVESQGNSSILSTEAQPCSPAVSPQREEAGLGQPCYFVRT